MSDSSLEIVTCSYGPDAGLCELLVESVCRFVPPTIVHSVIVPRRDEALFRHLESPRTRILFQEDVLPRKLRRVPGSSRFSLLGTTPVRGWLQQQIVKLGIGSAVQSDVLVMIDSDAIFIRPFDASTVTHGGRVRLYANHGHAPIMPHIKWHRASARLLGLERRDWFGADYITHLTVWRRDVLGELLARIEGVSGAEWSTRVARSWAFSEYTVYGIFAEHVLGVEAGERQVLSDLDLALSSWSFDSTTDEGLEAFEAALAPHHVVIGIQSKDPVPYDRRVALYETLRRRAAV